MTSISVIKGIFLFTGYVILVLFVLVLLPAMVAEWLFNTHPSRKKLRFLTKLGFKHKDAKDTTCDNCKKTFKENYRFWTRRNVFLRRLSFPKVNVCPHCGHLNELSTIAMGRIIFSADENLRREDPHPQVRIVVDERGNPSHAIITDREGKETAKPVTQIYEPSARF